MLAALWVEMLVWLGGMCEWAAAFAALAQDYKLATRFVIASQACIAALIMFGESL